MIAVSDLRERYGRRPWLMVSAAVAALAALLGGLWLWLHGRSRSDETPASLPLDEIHGLSQEEARARYREGQSNAISFHPPRSRKQIIRENTLTIFNIGLVAIVFVQMMLGKYLDALMSVGVLIFTIGVNVFQEEFARIRLRKIMQEARPRAHVLRDGRVRSIDPDHVVAGDVLAIGPGDQTVVDGKILAAEGLVMDESLIFAKGRAVTKQAGDEIFAGSLCISGRGAFQATRIAENRLIERKLEHLASAPESLTPIERIVNRTLQLLLAFVLAIAAFLIAKFFLASTPWPDEFTDVFIDAIGVIFSIAPAGLFFMIVLTYAGSTVDMMQRGALVHRARSIETLAQTDVICFGKSGFLTDDWVEMTPLAAKVLRDAHKPPSEIELQRMLGTCARSISMRNRISNILKQSYDGQQLSPVEEMPFLAIYGWSAVTLEDENMTGVFVLGAPHILQPHLHTAKKTDDDASRPILKQVASVGGRLGRLLGRKGKKEEAGAVHAGPDAAPASAATASAPVATVTSEDQTGPAEDASIEEQPASGPFVKRWGKSIASHIRRPQKTPSADAAKQEEKDDETLLMFAWLPEPRPLHDDEGAPQLPDGLIPLSQLSFQERINPDAVLALNEFYANGVMTSIFSPDPAQETLNDLRKAGITEESAARLQLISGEELADLDETAFVQAVNEHHIFGSITPELMTRAVQALRASGHRVGVVGGGAGEIHAMLNADISLTTLTASSGALSIADIILLETSPAVTARILDKGQRIVNGLLDVLKLYLTQALYLLILIIVLLATLKGFPYRGSQGGLIAAFAISIPAIAVTLTAPAGRLNTRHLGRRLSVFVLPAGVSIAAAGYIIFNHFLKLYGHLADAQNALVHGLIFIGLLLAMLIRPPIFFTTSVNTLARNLLTVIVAIISGALFLLTTHIGLAQKFLYIEPLKSAADYRFVAVVSLLWAAGFGAYLLFTFRIKHLFGESR